MTYRNFHVRNGAPLTIYLDGDGNPGAKPGPQNKRGADPTTNERLILKLLRSERRGAILLGRPCYYLVQPEPTCNKSWWTSARYSERVLTRLTQSIDRLVAEHRPSRIDLVGYSGGGALAVLLAARIPDVRSVVTIAANLDTDTWAKMHGAQPLTGSLNPLNAMPLPARIRQRHLYGGKDRQVPPDSALAAFAKDPNAHRQVIEDFDHRCCWAERWPELGVLPPPDRGSIR